jgi:hypothetical protein
MNKSSSLLKVVIILVGVAVFIAMLWFPQIEGRNRNSGPIELYFNDPFLAYSYLASIPFFVGLYQGFKLVSALNKKGSFKKTAIHSLQIIKNCALISIGFIILGELILFFGEPEEDLAGIVALGIMLTFISLIVATSSSLVLRLLKK